MLITVKLLKGDGCTLNVESSTSILELKQEIQQKLNIPVDNQKLLLLGRPLSNEKTVSFYPTIKEGTKLNLVVKQTEGLDSVVFRAFRKYYNEQNADRLTKIFLLNLSMKLKLRLSLDDLERISARSLRY